MILKRFSSFRPIVNNLVTNLKHVQPTKGFRSRFSSTASTSADIIGRNRETKIQIIGNLTEYDAIKQIRLIQLPDEFDPDPKLLASMHVKRNIIFGTRIHDDEYLAQISGDDSSNIKDGEEVGTETDDDCESTFNTFDSKSGFSKACKPLLLEALEQASREGDQPQGLAALTGLSGRVQYLIKNPLESEVMMKLKNNAIQNNGEDSDHKVIWEAIQAVATQKPRPGHSTVGIGTYFDSRNGWTELAKEYTSTRAGKMVVQGESQLFQSNGAILVGIEFIGEENPHYWIEAGGAMARFIFV